MQDYLATVQSIDDGVGRVLDFLDRSGLANNTIVIYTSDFWKKDQWELFDLVNDPFELHNLYGQRGQEHLTATLKAELSRLKQAVRDEDQLANEQLPNGVDGPVAKLRGK